MTESNQADEPVKSPSVFLSFVIQTNGLLQQNSQRELQLTTETQDYQDDSEDNSKRAHRSVFIQALFPRDLCLFLARFGSHHSSAQVLSKGLIGFPSPIYGQISR